MSGTDRQRNPVAHAAGLRRFRRFVVGLAMTLALTACTAGAPTNPPSTVPGATTAPVVTSPPTTAAPPTVASTPTASEAPTESATPLTLGASASVSGPATVITDAGTAIWTSLPATFPAYPGARPADSGGDPVSATLDLPANGSTASTWYQSALRAAGYTIVSARGPREDGSYELVATKGTADCQVEIRLAPLGATTTATIELAAACPFA